MEAGLAPGMVRKGLKLLREFSDSLEEFIVPLGLKNITTKALYYHNAILWEKYGFTYYKGGRMMGKIHEGFQPGGALFERLDDSTPFRKKGMEKTVRGRSWSLYDGLLEDALDEDWESPTMYRILGKEFSTNTFPGQIY